MQPPRALFLWLAVAMAAFCVSALKGGAAPSRQTRDLGRLIEKTARGAKSAAEKAARFLFPRVYKPAGILGKVVAKRELGFAPPNPVYDNAVYGRSHVPYPWLPNQGYPSYATSQLAAQRSAVPAQPQAPPAVSSLSHDLEDFASNWKDAPDIRSRINEAVLSFSPRGKLELDEQLDSKVEHVRSNKEFRQQFQGQLLKRYRASKKMQKDMEQLLVNYFTDFVCGSDC